MTVLLEYLDLGAKIQTYMSHFLYNVQYNCVHLQLLSSICPFAFYTSEYSACECMIPVSGNNCEPKGGKRKARGGTAPLGPPSDPPMCIRILDVSASILQLLETS